MRKAVCLVAFLAALAHAGPAPASSFGIAPRYYGVIVDEVLKQVGSNLRLGPGTCWAGRLVVCRFSSGAVTVLVQGQTSPARTSKIVIQADVLRDAPETDPFTVVAHAVDMFGATMAVFDRDLPAQRRVELLSDLTATALETGASEGEGVAARYLLTFDQGASGTLVISVTPSNEAIRLVRRLLLTRHAQETAGSR